VAISKNAKVELLRKTPLFSECSKAELGALALTADELDLREGTVLTYEGRAGREFFVLIEGTVSVTQKGKPLADLGPGDWLGEVALLTDVPRTATVTATSPLRVLVLTDRAFRQAVKGMPTIALKVLDKVGERLGHDAHR
jgi:CRP/FNR family transcriptional regulator, cyclic AMP receptor protein